MVEIILQPQADAVVHPVVIELVADAAQRLFGRRHAFQFAQDALAVIDERAREQALFVFERDLVGAPRRRQHRDHDADDRDRNDDADRNDDREPRAVPTRLARSCRPNANWSWPPIIASKCRIQRPNTYVTKLAIDLPGVKGLRLPPRDVDFESSWLTKPLTSRGVQPDPA